MTRGPSPAELRVMLEQRAVDVAQRYAPPAAGSYTDKGEYWTLNPGRADNSVGSFVVHVSGPRLGHWKDFATGEHGDFLDLIRLSLSCDLREAMAEARRFLGLQDDTPQARAARKKAVAEAEARRAAAAAEAEQKRRARARYAHALWLNAQPSIKGTPAEIYLRDRRAIDLSQLGRQPRALRFAPRLKYHHMDNSTGEVTEGYYPAMLALVHGLDGATLAVHRTFLAEGPQGWDKAPVPKPKMVIGSYPGGCIHLRSGIGPRGGKAPPLSRAAPGSRVYITEGIEDGLSVALAAPHLRVLCAISLSNMGAVQLPPAIAEVTLVADRDESPEARSALDRAIAAHREAGRRVYVWQAPPGIKDFNDYWRAKQKELADDGELDNQDREPADDQTEAT